MTDETISSIIIGTLFGLFIVVFLNLWAIERDRNLYFPDTTSTTIQG